ncbi:MAG: CDP-alcohol phosphatidyltransferase family protein [Oscillospiraceae bacterium]|nr:CDP-alcohol phosphatidyltransferase family protein [Oscillospiraceae bacterium]
MIGFYNYTVILTYLGLLSGFGGILCASSGNLKAALLLLLVAGLCDMFDGLVASTMKRTKSEKRFGIQIDSLSDLICFGVLPAVICFYCTNERVFHGIIPGLYLLCALIRLAWFNVDEEDRQDKQVGSRKHYLGLPVTTSALIVPFFVGLGELLSLPLDHVTSWLLLVVAIAFITPFRMKKAGCYGKLGMIAGGIATLLLVIFGV